MSLQELQNVPLGELRLVSGAPGVGKSAFCHELAVRLLASGLPVIYVTSRETAGELLDHLHDQGLRQGQGATLLLVDAYGQTVGVRCAVEAQVACANCADLNSLSIAITKQQARLGGPMILVLDFLTSPYLFCGAEVVRFMRIFLSKLTANGHGVLAVIDQGCGREADLVTMRSIADSVIALNVDGQQQLLQAVKQCEGDQILSAARPFIAEPDLHMQLDMDPQIMGLFAKSFFQGQANVIRPQTGD